MITLYDKGVLLPKNAPPIPADNVSQEGRTKTCACKILQAHNTSGNLDKLKIKFDSLTSHDITYVSVIQTARASGLREFPLPYVLTNCHNSLCAVGGTINEDDHVFGLSAAKKYGGIYVPAHMAVLHQYMREMMAGCGKMILGSDSHTRYGALGTLAIGEGGPELVKQLLGRTYDIDMPEVTAVYLTGRPADWVGPQDVALALIGAVFKNGFVKNRILEFVGPGIAGLSAEYRMGIDVMTTETACLSSIWRTDNVTAAYLEAHGRGGDFNELAPDDMAYYDRLVTVDLSKVKPMIALPFHPSNVYEIETLNANLDGILAEVEKAGQAQIENPNVKLSLRDKIKDGKLTAQQGIIAGCAGGSFENITAAADIIGTPQAPLNGRAIPFTLYPASQPISLALVRGGQAASLMSSGAVMRTAFCGPCFGAGDTPANNSLSIRHTTRNFPSREGSKPQNGQLASVALMDARSIAATVLNGGRITSAADLDVTYTAPEYRFDGGVYNKRCYFGFGNPLPREPLVFGPGIADWPEVRPLPEDLLLKLASVIKDPVTTTDELIPSGETASYRSNPLELASFTLQRKDPAYVPKARAMQRLEQSRLSGGNPMETDRELSSAWRTLCEKYPQFSGRAEAICLGSAIYAIRPGDGSAREQAASCQRVLGTIANFANEYATKRYRSNLINWGMLPFICEGAPFEPDDLVFLPGIKAAVQGGAETTAYVIRENSVREISVTLGGLTDTEREIILRGCLINLMSSS